MWDMTGSGEGIYTTLVAAPLLNWTLKTPVILILRDQNHSHRSERDAHARVNKSYVYSPVLTRCVVVGGFGDELAPRRSSVHLMIINKRG